MDKDPITSYDLVKMKDGSEWTIVLFRPAYTNQTIKKLEDYAERLGYEITVGAWNYNSYYFRKDMGGHWHETLLRKNMMLCCAFNNREDAMLYKLKHPRSHVDATIVLPDTLTDLYY